MRILVAGVRHQTAPIEVREKVALSEAEIQPSLQKLLALPAIRECVILTTCNRVELYAAVEDTETAMTSIQTFFRQFKDFDWQAHRKYVFTLLNEDAIRHLYQVASGLDSLILGEGQILAQVKDALVTAQSAKTSGVLLDKLFKSAMTVGKRVRTETGIAQRDVSVAQAAYQFVLRQDSQLLDRRIGVLGGGKMAEILLEQLKQDLPAERRGQVTMLNRSQTRLQDLMAQFGFSGLTWEGIGALLENTDVLFVATGAPHVVLPVEMFQGCSPKLIIDISVPRNVAPEVADLPGMTLFNADNLGEEAEANCRSQAAMLAMTQQILEEEYQEFQAWRISLPAHATIAQLRAHAEKIRKTETENHRNEAEALALGDSGASGDSLSERLDRVTRSIVNKLLHKPSVRIRSAGTNRYEIERQAALLRYLFDVQEMEQLPLPTELTPREKALR